MRHRKAGWIAGGVSLLSGVAMLGVGIASSVGAEAPKDISSLRCSSGAFIQEEDSFGGPPFRTAGEAVAAVAQTRLKAGLTASPSTAGTVEGGIQYSYADSSGATVALLTASGTAQGGWTVDQVVDCSDQAIDFGGRG